MSTNTVTAVGMEDALKIYYHAAVNKFTSTTNFSNARTLLADSAESLFGECSDEWQAVHESFDAVNVPGDWSTCDGDPDPPVDPPPGGGDNVALGADAEASTTYNSSYSASRLTDGDDSKEWVSKSVWQTGKYQWVKIEFASSQSISEVTVKWRNNYYPKQYKIHISNGSNWVQKVFKSKSSAGTTTDSFDTTSTHEVLIEMNYAKSSYYAINEVEIK